MAAWSAFLPLIARHAPGAADIVIEAEARQAAIEFCEESLSLQRVLPPVPLVRGQALQSLVFDGEIVVKLLAAWIDGKPLGFFLPQDVDGAEVPAPGAPDAVSMAGPMQVLLRPAPAVGGVLTVRAAMRPSQAATSLDDGVFERHAQIIADLAISRMTSTPGRVYTDGAAAQAAQARYQSALDALRPKVFRARTRGSRAGSSRMTWC